MRTLLPSATQSLGRWVQRALFALAALAFAVVAFFFVTVALVAAATVVAVIAVRWWWLVRKLKQRARAEQGAGPLEGEYTIVEHERIEHRGEDHPPR